MSGRVKQSEASEIRRFWVNPPFPAWLIALFILIVTLFPVWRGQLQSHSDWTFTGNISASPDMMQYRVWMRQTQQEGPLVSNRFTPESNSPYLLLHFYWLVGKISNLIGISPEFVYAYTGGFLAFSFSLFLFLTVRWFLISNYAVWTLFLCLLLGGGFGVHLKILAGMNWVRNSEILNQMIVVPLASLPVFEDFRGSYVFLALSDTHYLLNWITVPVSVLSLYAAVKKSSYRMGIPSAVLFGFTTLLHVYQGFNLLSILAFIALACWKKRILTRFMFQMILLCASTVCLALLFHFLLFQNSSLPLSRWRGTNLLFSTLLLAFPVAWLVLLRYPFELWRKARLSECFLIGWALGCLAIIFSGPFYPYPARGILTLQIPLFLLAGIVYFRHQPRLSSRAVLFLIAVLGLTPLWITKTRFDASGFKQVGHIFISQDHLRILNQLQQRSGPNDILLANHRDLLWIAPGYSGRHFAGHFFLTVHYENRRKAMEQFFRIPQRQASLLERENIRFVYVDLKENPTRFKQIPGLDPIVKTDVGWLFEFHQTKNDHRSPKREISESVQN
jgi:hypothetical protein